MIVLVASSYVLLYMYTIFLDQIVNLGNIGVLYFRRGFRTGAVTMLLSRRRPVDLILLPVLKVKISLASLKYYLLGHRCVALVCVV